jgi:hypothetical protein
MLSVSNLQKMRTTQLRSRNNLNVAGFRYKNTPRYPAGYLSRLTVNTYKSGLILEFLVFLTESFYTACRVHQFLLACEKRMALGADFNADVLPGGSDLYDISASALNVGFGILRVNTWFHFTITPCYSLETLSNMQHHHP